MKEKRELRSYSYFEPTREGKMRKVVYLVGSKVCNGLVYIRSIEQERKSNETWVTSVYVGETLTGEFAKWKEISKTAATIDISEFNWSELLNNDR